jgi:hypothetical protein
MINSSPFVPLTALDASQLKGGNNKNPNFEEILNVIFVKRWLNHHFILQLIDNG